MITITDKAVQKIKEIADNEGIKEYSIRVKIIANGCSGFSNDIFFESIFSDQDEIISQDGVQILIDQITFQYLDGSSIDYLEGLYNSGFKVNNPSITGSCGCGKSFSI